MNHLLYFVAAVSVGNWTFIAKILRLFNSVGQAIYYQKFLAKRPLPRSLAAISNFCTISKVVEVVSRTASQPRTPSIEGLHTNDRVVQSLYMSLPKRIKSPLRWPRLYSFLRFCHGEARNDVYSRWDTLMLWQYQYHQIYDSTRQALVLVWWRCQTEM